LAAIKTTARVVFIEHLLFNHLAKSERQNSGVIQKSIGEIHAGSEEPGTYRLNDFRKVFHELIVIES